MTDTFRNLVCQIGETIRDRALQAKADKAAAPPCSDDAMFQAGRLLAFNEVISIMQQTARGFEVPLRELRLDGIKPDRDLV